MKAIVLLADSVNRRHLSIYGNPWVKTPSLERLGRRSTVFTRHFAGSAPCMPARRDMMTGRLNFLERNWGPIEPFDHALPQLLRAHGLFTHLVTDHYHYLEIGGENYCQLFDTWECFRGQESDPWVSRVTLKPLPEHLGQLNPHYILNRQRFQSEEDFPSPRTLRAATEWLAENREADDYLLWVEVFDPHEPFDVPEEYLRLYGDDFSGPLYFWPAYAPTDVSQEALRHVERRYAALLTMTDRWLGRLFDLLDEQGRWDDTLVVFTTDHGFMFGEHGFMAKNYMPAYNEVFHIPLLVHLPGQETPGEPLAALTQSVDFFPTLLDHFGVPLSACRNRLHGRSLLPLLSGQSRAVRDVALYGYFGRNVNVTDGRYTYFRAAARPDNSPLFLYTAMPTTFLHYFDVEHLRDVRDIEMGRSLSWTDFPVFRIPAASIRMKDANQSFDRNQYVNRHLLFDLETDYAQEHPLENPALERRMLDLLREALSAHDAPPEQFVRLGL